MDFKFAKKIKNKTNSSFAPPPPTNTFFELRIRKNMWSPPLQSTNSAFCPPLAHGVAVDCIALNY